MSTVSTLASLIRLHQICCGHITYDDGTTKEIKNNRMEELLEIIQEADRDWETVDIVLPSISVM